VTEQLRDEPFDDRTKQSIAENEVRFRAANERIEDAGERFGFTESPMPFICECGRATCVVVIRATIPQYEEVRADARHFMCAPGHEITGSGIGRVVREESGFVVVEKLDGAADVAEATDPR
jgi:hypothetical protein